jgi:murein DD-endopeptidase MepM/ murein hydrolase activator NlpD
VAASNNGFTKRHPALDIAAAKRTRVYSIRAGKVAAKGYDKVRGHWVTLKHWRGIESTYEHLDAASPLGIGQRVRTLWGSIGYVGETGIATGPHLHLAIFVNGKPVDPDSWLTKH